MRSDKAYSFIKHIDNLESRCHIPILSALRRRRQEDVSFKDRLGDVASSRLAVAMWWEHKATTTKSGAI